MYWPVIKIVIAACVISFSSWLSGKRPDLAGFIIALPLSTMLVLAFSYAEYNDPAASVKFAKSILAAIPLSLLFFVPFLFAHKINLPFWGLYGLGVAFLTVGYFAHTLISKHI